MRLQGDVLVEILAFHDHADVVESAYVGRSFLAAVRRLALRSPGLREAFLEACRDCGRHEQFCECEVKSKRIGWLYFLFALALVIASLLYPVIK
jgi:hypothetical protein